MIDTDVLKRMPVEHARKLVMMKLETARLKRDDRAYNELAELDSDLFEVTFDGVWWVEA